MNEKKKESKAFRVGAAIGGVFAKSRDVAQKMQENIKEYQEKRARRQSEQRKKDIERYKSDTEYYKARAGRERQILAYHKTKQQGQKPSVWGNNNFGEGIGQSYGNDLLGVNLTGQARPQRKQSKKRYARRTRYVDRPQNDWSDWI